MGVRVPPGAQEGDRMKIGANGCIILDNPDEWWKEIDPTDPNDPSHGHYFIMDHGDEWCPRGALLKVEKKSGYDYECQQVTGEIYKHGNWWHYRGNIRYWGPTIEKLPIPIESYNPYLRFTQIAKGSDEPTR